LALLLILTGIGVRLVFPPFASLSKDLAAGNFAACELFQEFTGDPTGAFIRLGGKIVILEGEVAAAGDGYIIMGKEMCVVRCLFRTSIYDRNPDVKTGDRLVLKGVCQGLNRTEVLVTHCIITKKNDK
jgi:hypothetical protein